MPYKYNIISRKIFLINKPHIKHHFITSSKQVLQCQYSHHPKTRSPPFLNNKSIDPLNKCRSCSSKVYMMDDKTRNVPNAPRERNHRKMLEPNTTEVSELPEVHQQGTPKRDNEYLIFLFLFWLYIFCGVQIW